MQLEAASEILFELGSEDRIEILGALGREPLKLSQIATKMGFSIQEASRQCGRLEQVGLVEKKVDGLLTLTSVGRISLSLIPAFAFLNEEKDYFESHDPSVIPPVFVERLGELFERGRIEHINDALIFQQRVSREAESFVWFLSDQPVGHSLHESHSHFSEKVTLKMILPKQVDLEIFRAAKNSMGSRFEIAVLEEVKLLIAMNEKSAAFGLPTLDGRLDYSRGFVGNSPSFIGWCRDLFSYFWERASKIYPPE